MSLSSARGGRANQERGTSRGAGHGHPQNGAEEVIRHQIRLHNLPARNLACEESKLSSKEIRQLPLERCPLPISSYSPLRLLGMNAIQDCVRLVRRPVQEKQRRLESFENTGLFKPFGMLGNQGERPQLHGDPREEAT